VILLFLGIVGFVLYPYMLVTVPSGQAGVLWKRFTGPGFYCLCIVPSGTVLDPAEVRNEGLHIIWPWDKLFLYNIRLQTSTQNFNAISQDGVSVTAEVTLRYQLDFNWIAVLHQFIGPNYLRSVLTPSIASTTRSIIAKYKAEEVYSTRRQQIEAEIREAAVGALRQHLDKLFQASASAQHDLAKYQNSLQNSMQIIDTLVLSIELPSDIVAAINRKTEQFYLIQEYQYRVQREVEEARRKQIEANGIAAFQRTVTSTMSEFFLRWQGIQATLALAQSKNSKIVVIGSGKDGLPIILGNVDTPPAPVEADQSENKKNDKNSGTPDKAADGKSGRDKDSNKSGDNTASDRNASDDANKSPGQQTPNSGTKPNSFLNPSNLLSKLNDALNGKDKDKDKTKDKANSDKDQTTDKDKTSKDTSKDKDSKDKDKTSKDSDKKKDKTTDEASNTDGKTTK
jgi:regulator of protease activity HflC (stomatin/prohibitin superfamily)